MTGHISRNCPRDGDRGKIINTIVKSKFELRPILDMGAAVSLVPDGTYLRYATKVNTDETVRLTDGKTLRLGYKRTLNLVWENGDRLTLNEAYTATSIKDIIISAVQLIERQGLICVINKNGTYLCSERRKDGNRQEQEHDGGVIRFKNCAIDGDMARAKDMANDLANGTAAVSADSNKNAININTPKETNVNNNKNNRVTRHNDWSAEISAINTRNAVTWHRRLGHINFRKLGEAYKTVDGIGKVTAPNMVCEVCTEAKATRKPCKQTRARVEKPGFRTHADLIGPIIPATYLQCGRYILTLVDDYSRHATTYILKNKKETADRLEAYFKYIRTLFPEPGRLAALCTDAGTEFSNARVRKILKEMDIRLELAEADIHEHNGTAERFNRTHQNKIRALLFDAGFPNTFWGWASDAATYYITGFHIRQMAM